MIPAIAMLASRECKSDRPIRRSTPGRWVRSGSLFDAGTKLVCSVDTVRVQLLDGSRSRQNFFLGGTAFVTVLGAQIGIDTCLGYKLQAGVNICRPAQTARDLVHEQHHDRVEALQVRLLVDGELEITFFDRIQSRRKQIKTSAMHFAL